MATGKPKKSSFIQGAISAEFIGNSIAKHQSKTTIGAHNIFLGQVRGDEIDGKIGSLAELLSAIHLEGLIYCLDTNLGYYEGHHNWRYILQAV